MRIAPILAALALAGAHAGAFAQADDLAAARAAARGGDLTTAGAAINRHLALNPTDERGLFLKGVILSEQGRMSEAFDVFQFQAYDDFLQYDYFLRRIVSSQRLALELEFQDLGNHWIRFSLGGSSQALERIAALDSSPQRKSLAAGQSDADRADVVDTGPTDTNTTTFLAGDEAKIRPACEEKWPDDFSARALCVEMQTDGFRTVRQFIEKQGIQSGDTTPAAEILDSCSRKWRGLNGRPDWSATALCVEMQMDGYERLNPSG